MFLRLWSALMLLSIIVTFGGTALAIPPPNDDCTNATAISSNPFNQVLDTTEATTEVGGRP